MRNSFEMYTYTSMVTVLGSDPQQVYTDEIRNYRQLIKFSIAISSETAQSKNASLYNLFDQSIFHYSLTK